MKTRKRLPQELTAAAKVPPFLLQLGNGAACGNSNPRLNKKLGVGTGGGPSGLCTGDCQAPELARRKLHYFASPLENLSHLKLRAL